LKNVRQSRAARNREESNRQILEYIQVPLGRPFHVAIPFVLSVLASMAALYSVAPKFKSSTLILVEAEKMPESFVAAVATEQVSRRLQTVRQEVLSRTRLETVIRELAPYGEVGEVSLTAMVEWMRAGIEVTVKGGDAFVIDYVHGDPAMAQKVAHRLAQLFIDETVHSRKQQVGEAYEFLETELEEAKGELEKREEALRRYKERHMGTLPEQMNANLATLQRLQQEQQAVSQDLRSAMDRLIALETAPQPTLGKTGPVDPRGEIALLRTQLSSLRTRYTDEHPDVKALITQIQGLEKAIVAPGPASGGSGSPQLDQARADVKNLRLRLEELDKRIGTFQGRVELAPRTEQDIVELTRDFEKLKENYLALLNKKLEAQMAAKLEQRWQGDRFRILDPANLPERPFSPSRRNFLLAGMLMGIVLGVAAAFAADFFDHSIRTVRELEETLPFPVLAHLQLITTAHRPPDSKRRRPTTPSLTLDPTGTEDGHFEVASIDRAREDRRQGRR
jgi:polysaccharide chain length determinant protein (PEP-CTERM system associated)